MEYISVGEQKSLPASQEISHAVWKPDILYRMYKTRRNSLFWVRLNPRCCYIPPCILTLFNVLHQRLEKLHRAFLDFIAVGFLQIK